MARTHRIAALGAALILSALPAAAQDGGSEDPEFYLEIPANTRAEVYIGREPILLLICLVGGSRATIDIASERVSRAVLERDECVLVSEREVFATASDGEAAVQVRVIRN
jgi:hypothetical protein